MNIFKIGGELRRFLRELMDTRQRRRVLRLVLLALALALLEAAGVGAVVPFVILLRGGAAALQSGWGKHLADLLPGCDLLRVQIFVGSTVLALFLLKNALAVVQVVRASRFAQDFFQRLAGRLFAAYLEMPYLYHLRTHSAVLVKNIVNETKLIAEQVVGPALTLFAEICVLTAILLVLLIYNPWIFLAMAVIGSGVLALISGISLRQNRTSGIERDRSLAEMMKTASDGLAGIRDVKIGGAEGFFLRQMDRCAGANAAASARGMIWSTLPRLLIESVLVIGLMGAILLVLAGGSRREDLVLSLGVYLVAAYRLLPSVNRITTSLMIMRFYQAGWQTVVPVLYADLQRERDLRDTPPLPPFQRELAVVHGAFQYPATPAPVFTDVHMRIPHGRRIGITGASGSGKSTLVNVLAGLLPPCAGHVELDGVALTANQLGRLRELLAYVPQNVFLIDDTLLRNIALGEDDAAIDDGRVRRALRLAQLDELVAGLPEGLVTRVGERGARLSGGQVQRIGIARALYRARPLLILDEATSALDAATERAVLEAIRTGCPDVTLIMIAHKSVNFAVCDSLYRVSGGAVLPVERTDVT